MFPLLKRFARSDRGNVALIFGLTAIPLVLAVGAALDYSRAAAAHVGLQAGVDATTLALCKSTVTSTSALAGTAATMLASYEPTYPITIDALTAASAPRTVSLTAHISYPTAFMQLAGIASTDVGATATCSAGETYYEIALVLDTTGSMAESSGGVTKLAALQTAATNFVSTMFSSVDTTHLKISLVPFAASVKVDPTTYASASWLDLQGKSSLHWQNVINPTASGFTSRFDIFKKLAASYSGWAWAGCLESLPYPLNVQDGAPTAANADSYYVPLFAPDEVGNKSSSSSVANSYIDDGSSSSGSCDNNVSSTATRMGQACKYVSPKNIQTSQSGPNWMCNSRALTRLTNSQSTLTSEIGKLTAAGNTDIHEGFIWGWRTISPNSVFADGAAYTTSSSTKNVVKIIVLMTDGTNTWTADSSNTVTKSYYSAYGYFTNADGSTPKARLTSATASPTSSSAARTAIDALTAEACTNAKAAGVTVYSVGFSISSDPIDSAGQTLLSNCASQTSNYFLASNSTALNTAFSSIAQGIGQLRLTH